jgi:hypothetical protein
MHPMDLKPMTSPFTLKVQGKEMGFELELIGKKEK